ncbi:hypothetical protein SBOR_5574 [Sclerotinia borealis F-4128]|uniref:Uncharacterized protein n=1 Tax=Sclerotinia borealis (strain F-4128) TaxID=1432307 RepID=W9CDX5_SCLBF|nr:hypothetical protein SBOR_5574 [Sclerotinia borealis F-4128]
MNLRASPNNESGALTTPLENHGSNCLRDHVMLLKMSNSKALTEAFSTINFLWLRRNTPWPMLVKLAVYRFLHLHNFYQIDQDDKINKLVDYLFKEGELSNDPHCRGQMMDRCNKLILSTYHWITMGLLVYNKDNLLVKSAIFQNAWNNQLSIMHIRTNHTDVEQPNNTIASEQHSHIPARMSVLNSVPELFVAVSSPVYKGKDNPSIITSDEPDIKVDLDGPVYLINCHAPQVLSEQSYSSLSNPRIPVAPALEDTLLNKTNDSYHSSASSCHGLPDFGFDVQESQVPPPNKTSVAHAIPWGKAVAGNINFSKDPVCHNYPSEASFLHQLDIFKSAAHLLVSTPNKFSRIVSYEAMVLIWQRDEFTFFNASWSSGFTIDINDDKDLIRARQRIWDGFWMFVDGHHEFTGQNFQVFTNPKLPHVPLVPLKRPMNSTLVFQGHCPRGDEKRLSSDDSNGTARRNSSARSSGQASNENASSSGKGNQRFGQASVPQKLPQLPQRPVGRQRKTNQKTNISQPKSVNAQQSQQQWSRQFRSLTGSEKSVPQLNPLSHGLTQTHTSDFQPNNLDIQPQGKVPITGHVQSTLGRSNSTLNIRKLSTTSTIQPSSTTLLPTNTPTIPRSNHQLTPTIQFRIQLSPTGPFSTPYPKWILGTPGKPPVTIPQLFSWFINITRIDHKQGLDSLTCRLKDAVPVPIVYTVSRNESGSVDGVAVDALAKLRKDIKRECEKAGRLVLGLKKFEIFVGVTVTGDEGGRGEGGVLVKEGVSRPVLGEEW